MKTLDVGCGIHKQPGSIGLGFAIPIDEVMPVIQQMENGETPTHARLGIGVENVAAGDVTLDDEDMAALDDVEHVGRPF